MTFTWGDIEQGNIFSLLCTVNYKNDFNEWLLCRQKIGELLCDFLKWIF